MASPFSLPVLHEEDHNNHSTDHGMPNPSSHGGHASHRAFLFTDTTGFFVLFAEASIDSGGAFAGAFILSLLFALVTTVASLCMKRAEDRALKAYPPSAVRTLVVSTSYAIRMAFHYFNMLLTMTMSVWIIVAVVAGHGFGFFVDAMAMGRAERRRDAEADGKMMALDREDETVYGGSCKCSPGGKCDPKECARKGGCGCTKRAGHDCGTPEAEVAAPDEIAE